MPYEVVKDESACSASEPWAVKKKGGSKVYGCHSSKAEAQKQQAALYANEEQAAAQAAVDELAAIRGIYTRVGPLPAIQARPTIIVKAAADTVVALADVKDVPLFEIGMDFPASTGPVSFSFQHLAAAVQAGSDPVIPRPRIKLGHTDPRFNDSQIYDGDPNFGFIEDLRLTNEGGVVTADLVDVPVWLASIMPVAYPSRSIEGWFGYTGPNEKSYEFVVTAVALLGVCWPGVMSLADLPRMAEMYGPEMPDFVEIIEQEAA